MYQLIKNAFAVCHVRNFTNVSAAPVNKIANCARNKIVITTTVEERTTAEQLAARTDDQSSSNDNSSGTDDDSNNENLLNRVRTHAVLLLSVSPPT